MMKTGDELHALALQRLPVEMVGNDFASEVDVGRLVRYTNEAEALGPVEGFHRSNHGLTLDHSRAQALGLGLPVRSPVQDELQLLANFVRRVGLALEVDVSLHVRATMNPKPFAAL